MKNKKIIWTVIIIIIIILIYAAVFFSYFKKSDNKPVVENIPVVTEDISAPKYDFKQVAYNFWGKVLSKDNEGILIEGIVPKASPSEKEINQTVKFKISSDAKIVKQSDEAFYKLEDIQIGDRVAVKSEGLNVEKKEALATDILILDPMPDQVLKK